MSPPASHFGWENHIHKAGVDRECLVCVLVWPRSPPLGPWLKAASLCMQPDALCRLPHLGTALGLCSYSTASPQRDSRSYDQAAFSRSLLKCHRNSPLAFRQTWFSVGPNLTTTISAQSAYNLTGTFCLMKVCTTNPGLLAGPQFFSKNRKFREIHHSKMASGQ